MACLNSVGTVPDWSDSFTIIVSNGTNISRLSYNNCVGMGSREQVLGEEAFKIDIISDSDAGVKFVSIPSPVNGSNIGGVEDCTSNETLMSETFFLKSLTKASGRFVTFEGN